VVFQLLFVSEFFGFFADRTAAKKYLFVAAVSDAVIYRCASVQLNYHTETP
jgi:hypothetical protein